MSRIGKNPVMVPAGVDIDVDGRSVTVKGKLGVLSRILPEQVDLSREDDKFWVKPRDNDRQTRAAWGLSRSLVSNMVIGVSEGFTRKLEITGVGYRAAIDGKVLNLQLGYSHDIKVAVPDDITVKCEKPTEISIHGADRQRVGQLAADIRRLRPPEPYKGKGVRYSDEIVRRKDGKKK